MLIDGGGNIGAVHTEFDFGEDVVAPYLWSRGLQSLDVVVLTHAHADHIGGLPRIIEDFHPSELWLGINPEKDALLHLLTTASANHVVIQRHTAGDEFEWGGAKIRVLSPPADWQPQPNKENEDSLAMLIGYGETRALLAGDLERKMEQFVATESPTADLLKVAHHGSSDFYHAGAAGGRAPAHGHNIGWTKFIWPSARDCPGAFAVRKSSNLPHRPIWRRDILLDGKRVEARLPSR